MLKVPYLLREVMKYEKSVDYFVNQHANEKEVFDLKGDVVAEINKLAQADKGENSCF